MTHRLLYYEKIGYDIEEHIERVKKLVEQPEAPEHVSRRSYQTEKVATKS